jgi:hypothetical protein
MALAVVVVVVVVVEDDEEAVIDQEEVVKRRRPDKNPKRINAGILVALAVGDSDDDDEK